jgi:hypothetical protein
VRIERTAGGSFVDWKSQQVIVPGRDKRLTAGHKATFFSKTLLFEK